MGIEEYSSADDLISPASLSGNGQLVGVLTNDGEKKKTSFGSNWAFGFRPDVEETEGCAARTFDEESEEWEETEMEDQEYQLRTSANGILDRLKEFFNEDGMLAGTEIKITTNGKEGVDRTYTVEKVE